MNTQSAAQAVVIDIPVNGKQNARRLRVPDALLLESYQRTGSVHKTGRELGINHATVHNRLRILGANKKINVFTADEDAVLLAEYEAHAHAGTLADLAAKMGRTKPFIARQARRLGLTDRKRSRAYLAEPTSLRLKKWFANNPHPRGMLGKTHTDATKERVRETSRLKWATDKAFGIGFMSPDAREKRRAASRLMMQSRSPEKMFTRALGGHRSDLEGKYFRSSWEANYARYLNLLMRLGAVVSWEFEPKTFWFEGVRRGVTNYKPDFRVFYKGDPTPEYIELKGWITNKDRTKWRRMKKYHPHIKLVVIASKEYAALYRKWASSIPNWEGGKQGVTFKREAAAVCQPVVRGNHAAKA